MQKLPSDLTKAELEKAVADLVQFYDFTFFGERGATESDGLTFAVEMQACSLGLVGDWLYNGDYDTADMMQDFVKALDNAATGLGLREWAEIKKHLPYIK